ncbi:MAG: ABC transporter ATP-binding protein [Candidatus Geothermarchaeales archaeon]
MSLEVKNVTSGYLKWIDVLHDVSVYSERAKISAIIGPNGAGKSTLLKTVYGFLKPKSGKIIFDGEDITGVDPYTMVKKGIAYIPQRRTVFPFLTVHENLEMGAWTLHKKEETLEKIREVYDRFPRLEERRSVLAGSLSGGEQRMLEIGRTLIISPKLILIDEPTGGLAPKVAEMIYKKLTELSGEGITILLVDQNVREAIELAHHIYVLELGRNTVDGDREKFERDIKDIIRDWLSF